MLSRAARRIRRFARAGAAGETVGPRTLEPEFREFLRGSPLFHQPWVEAQLGTAFASFQDALDAYLASPGCTPHPLFLPDHLSRRFARGKVKVDPVQWYLRHSDVQRGTSPHPLFDLDPLRLSHPELFAATNGPLVAWLETATPETPLPVPPGVPAVSYGELIAESISAARDWHTDRELRGAPRTVSERPEFLVADADVVPVTAGGNSGEPLVSIVMPMWNRGHSVRAAIASVQAQSFQDWELLVVDDGSTDDGLAVVTGIANFDARIVPVPAGHGGVSRARNEGLARARGRYIAFLDTDNTWRPQFLSAMAGALEREGWGMAHAALQATTGTDTYFRAYEGTYADLLVANYVDLNVLVVRSSLIREVGGFDEGLRRAVDYDLVLKLAQHSDLHLVPYVGVDYADQDDDSPRISTTERPEWLAVVASRHLMASAAYPSPRDDSLTSVVLPVPLQTQTGVHWVQRVAGRADLELILVGTRMPLLKHVVAALLVQRVGGRLIRLQGDRGAGTAINVGVSASRGTKAVVMLEPVDLESEDVTRLAAALDDPGVDVAIPVVIGASDLIHTAGATFVPGSRQPIPFLHDHATADLDGVGDVDLPAALGPVVAVRTRQLLDLGGFDPLFSGPYAETDLALRIHAVQGGRTRLLTDCLAGVEAGRPAPVDPVLEEVAEVEARASAGRLLAERAHPIPEGSAQAWTRVGFDVVGYDYPALAIGAVPPDSDPVRQPRPRLTPHRAQVVESPPRLRWTIDLASPGGRSGHRWGDTYFGAQLAAALRGLGQWVAVDPRDARHRATRDLDDVIMVLRGLDRVHPRPGRVNLQWIISHPDDITPEEVAGYDAVFAAGQAWAEDRTAAWGVPITPLLQATDPSLFHPGRAEFDTGDQILFVGNSRRIYRSSLRLASAAGLDVAVHGAGWEEILGEDAVASTFVDNAELGAMYAAAGLVLNDHWEDMRVGGFVSNRLMDAAASGARVASDPVPGVDLEELFHGLVRTYDTPERLRELALNRESHYPTGPERRAAALAVGSENSFLRRAETLLDTALRHWTPPDQSTR